MRLIVTLSDSQEQELQDLVIHHPKAYIREKAAAILKIAQGQSGVDVAQNGLLRKRRKNTVYDWVHRYQAEGISGLLVKKGRGLKPSFFP
ncbi:MULTISPECIES: helix-turn-helix domain-containing protein [unclassified Arcicella]|uniref:helix-turn-helix domain-containing protein n=1 Tax=unclassified Arcicella TaxID=2644986 RepID=UPI002864200B|nr:MULTISPECIES: helix-turn-helix domain-containing protein [unclassified Arcicella]MDR6565032.1 transposase [Arcicella sp. BE51]MDR6814845.1 transposase [Arcicella sp. BE140]MDR6826291.1 transposase [Arcicella sp. BE139]